MRSLGSDQLSIDLRDQPEGQVCCSNGSLNPARNTLRVVDLCAGMGGFHRGIELALGEIFDVQCIFASELDSELREKYVANFPDITRALSLALPRERVEALISDASDDLIDAVQIYNDDGDVVRIPGDLSAFVDTEGGMLRQWPETADAIFPDHDLLCAGFPCQPFSKSGAQGGFSDTRGTVFHLIELILKFKTPKYVFLENVGNFERHDEGRTWATVRKRLEGLGYAVFATLHKGSGSDESTGLLSPHHLGLPHHRERFFIVAELGGEKAQSPFPRRPASTDAQLIRDAHAKQALREITKKGWNKRSGRESPESASNIVSHWEGLLGMLKDADYSFRSDMPSFPIWGFELDPWNWYPIDVNPAASSRDRKDFSVGREAEIKFFRDSLGLADQKPSKLSSYLPSGERSYLSDELLRGHELEKWLDSLPAYAIKRDKWPGWKKRFIRQNREWAILLWRELDHRKLRCWLDELYAGCPAPSHQKLEWNCKGELLTLANKILQFRPSGIRVKRFAHVPALVAMTTTQTPLLTRMRAGEIQIRPITAAEGLELQGFPADWHSPAGAENTFRALGNAVHCGVIREIVRTWLVPRLADTLVGNNGAASRETGARRQQERRREP